jgi:hypothetical protein
MTAVSKKTRIITRSRYRRPDLLRQGKCQCTSGTNQKPGGKAPFIRQRVEDNAFHPIKGWIRFSEDDGKCVPA